MFACVWYLILSVIQQVALYAGRFYNPWVYCGFKNLSDHGCVLKSKGSGMTPAMFTYTHCVWLVLIFMAK